MRSALAKCRTTPPRILCPACRAFVATAEPVFADAIARRAAYRMHGEPSPRTVLEQQVIDAVGWTTLRGRGSRRARLRSAVERALSDRPEVYDWGYRRVVDKIRLQHLNWLVQDWIAHLLQTKPNAWRHAQEAGLPSWALEAVSTHVIPIVAAHGRRATVALVAASERIIANGIGIAPRTVRRRRKSRAMWTPARR